MTVRPVETAQAEQYGTMLMAFVANQTTRRGPAGPQAWQHRSRLATFSGRTRQLDGPGLVLPYLVSVLEEFALVRLRERVGDDLPDNPLVAHLWSKSEAEVEANWDKQLNAWKDCYGVTLSAFPRHQQLRGYREARNAIVHGLGHLTPRQLRGDGGQRTTQQLHQVGVRLEGRRLQLDESHLRDCARTAREFITWLDHQAQSAHVVAPT